MLAVYWLGLVTGTHLPRLPQGVGGYDDKTAHYLAYAGLAFLLSWSWSVRRPYFPKGLLFALGVAVLFGAVDELTQIPVPGRFGEPLDWLADSLGALSGICLFSCLYVMWHAWSAQRQ